MISYPSISPDIIKSGHWYVFGKLDGSNVRAEWVRNKGFVKFGKRNGLLDDQTPFLSQAKDLIISKYEKSLDTIFRQKKLENVTAFFEFYGTSSNYGVHFDEPHTVTLIDVHLYKKGILSPDEFLKYFDGIDYAPLLYTGCITQEIIQQVKDGTLPSMPFEGVVCKSKGRLGPVMFKLKSDAWMKKLREHCVSKSKSEQEALLLFERIK